MLVENIPALRQESLGDKSKKQAYASQPLRTIAVLVLVDAVQYSKHQLLTKVLLSNSATCAQEIMRDCCRFVAQKIDTRKNVTCLLHCFMINGFARLLNTASLRNLDLLKTVFSPLVKFISTNSPKPPF